MTLPQAWLSTVETSSAAIEKLAMRADRGARVGWCPGFDVAEVLHHLGVVHRVVRQWVLESHRPVVTPTMPDGAESREWFATGWRPLLETLSGLEPDTETSTWCSYDSAASFWWRRMAHETAIHAADVHDALGRPWSVPDDVALDGVDEALRLWLGTQLGPSVGGDGRVVRVTAGEQFWTVGLNGHNVEVNHLPVPPEAIVSGDPLVMYRWVWGRADDDAVSVRGDRDAVHALRAALARTMQ